MTKARVDAAKASKTAVAATPSAYGAPCSIAVARAKWKLSNPAGGATNHRFVQPPPRRRCIGRPTQSEPGRHHRPYHGAINHFFGAAAIVGAFEQVGAPGCASVQPPVASQPKSGSHRVQTPPRASPRALRARPPFNYILGGLENALGKKHLDHRLVLLLEVRDHPNEGARRSGLRESPAARPCQQGRSGFE